MFQRPPPAFHEGCDGSHSFETRRRRRRRYAALAQEELKKSIDAMNSAGALGPTSGPNMVSVSLGVPLKPTTTRGPPARCSFSPTFGWEGSPTKIDDRKDIGCPYSNLSTSLGVPLKPTRNRYIQKDLHNSLLHLGEICEIHWPKPLFGLVSYQST